MKISNEEFDTLEIVKSRKGRSKLVLEALTAPTSVDELEKKFGDLKYVLNYLRAKKFVEIRQNKEGVRFVKKL